MAPTISDDVSVPAAVYPDDIYITGMSGCFPNADSVKELEERIFNKEDLISSDERRWRHVHPEIPHRTGKINKIEKFDASFFGVHYKEAHTMDPMGRIMLEKTYEAIIDAGINPEELRHKKVGVFVGVCQSESENKWFYEKMHVNEYGIIGCSRTMFANRISQWLGVSGPSYCVDTACSSGGFALEHAYRAVKSGVCDSAIVVAANLLLHPQTSLQFSRMGVLSPDGRCKSFDDSANGYVRSEAISACYIQKAKDSRRVHAQMVHAKTNCDGFKEQGITYPAGRMQKLLLDQFYEECGVDPSTLEFVEAHGTGTRAGDPEELGAIDDVFCQRRDGPLSIGSIKSNLGHAEPTSALCSLAKVLIAYNTGYIPPNIHFNTPRQGIAGLAEGRLQVVTEKQPWNRGLAGVSSFGFGGANVHMLLKNVARAKVNNGLPSDDLPRLVCVSGRTEEAVAKVFDSLESRTLDADEVRLWHAIHENSIARHRYRGFVLLGSTPQRSIRLARDIKLVSAEKRPVWFVYSGMGSQWPAMARHLMRLPVFAAAIQKCDKVLESKGFNLLKLITDLNPRIFDNALYSHIGIAAIQVALTDVLTAVGIKPDHFIGQDIGELCCGYAEGRLSAEQVILSAFDKGQSVEVKQSNQIVDTVKLGYNQKPVSFEKALSSIHPNAIVIEVAPHGVLNEVLNFASRAASYVALSQKSHEDNLQVLFTGLGKLFESGVNPRLAALYPQVPFPVPQGTPLLSHLVQWEHREDWCVISYKDPETIATAERTITMSLQDEEEEYLSGHFIDGRTIYPATGYLVLAWETLAMTLGRAYTNTSVVFENVTLHRATNVPKEGQLEFIIMLHPGSGKFEITESNITIVTGRIYAKDNVSKDFRTIPPNSETETSGPHVKNILKKDFYKELNLRGYQYKGLFRSVLGCNVEGTRGRVAWDDNWVTFMDNMMQVNIVSTDTRSLYVPTRIEKLSIDCVVHSTIIDKMRLEGGNSIEFQVYPDVETTRSGGVELRGLHVTAISKRNPLGIPVFEKNVFYSNVGQGKFEDIIRVNLQLILENVQTYKFKAIELVDDEFINSGFEPSIEKVADVLADLPLVQDDLLVISDEPMEMPSNITVEKKKISGESNTIVFIGANLLERPKVLREAFLTLKEKCFIISREKTQPDTSVISNTYDVITNLYTDSEYLVMLREKVKVKPSKYLKVATTDKTFSWVDTLKEEMKDAQRIVLYDQGEAINGLLGLVNCLRKEPDGEIFRGVLICDKNAPPFDPELDFYKEQLSKDLALNVLQDGQWGTYRHLLLEDLETVRTPHAYVNATTIGDLSSLRWLEGSINEHARTDSNVSVVHVYSSALNFRDVMTAMGRVTLDAVARGRIAQDCVQGIEVSGRTNNGTRVMAICQKGLSNVIESDTSLVWSIPDEWSFDEAATVPVAYGTVYMALVMRGKIRRGESILIHAGSGGVGQAAINVALHYGLEVFTTVGTPDKRAVIKRLFPQLKDSHIGNSRDTSFENMIHRETKGRGVDVILNSLSDEKLQASARCLARRGRFLEIGKYDITNNTPIQMYFYQKEVSFHGIMLDYIYEDGTTVLRKHLQRLLLQGIMSGAVRPLTYCTFAKNKVEAAYRYMASGKHIGKVIVKIRDDERTNEAVKPTWLHMEAVPRYTCNENLVFIILGGLGGFGLELADWLILRGARKLVLTSRRGVSNGYQASRLRIWKTYGTKIEISTHDVTTEGGCVELLKLANSMGPVEAIFNLAVVLKDAVFQNQTVETFKTSFEPKALATMHLDKLSRKWCPNLRDFVIFSSVSCGRGNAGQTNYGFSNSVMERICEERKKEGLPAIAIQWGAIGDVGLVADMQEENVQLEIGGTLQQRISSCLLALDKFLKQEAAVVSSIVVAEKRAGSSGGGDIVDVIAQIIGIGDLKTVSQQTPLAEMGMDSIMAVEIKQTLEREFEIFLTAQEIRMLTFAKLTELTSQAAAESAPAPPQVADDLIGMSLIIRNFGDEALASEPFMYLPTKLYTSKTCVESIDESNMLFLLPGVESCASVMQHLCSQLDARACVLQLGTQHKNDTLELMADRLYKVVKPRLVPGEPFKLLGYSFGCQVILELAAQLEAEGHEGVVIAVDGSPSYLKELVRSKLSLENDVELQNSIISHTFGLVILNTDSLISMMAKVVKIDSYEDKVKEASMLSAKESPYSSEFFVSMARVTYERVKIMMNPRETPKKIKSPIVLIRPKEKPAFLDCNEKYDLDAYTESSVTVHYLDGNHVSIIESDLCADIVNDVLSEYSRDNKVENIVTNGRVRSSGEL